MKIYVSDAVAFLHYLLDKLPRDADNAFKEAEEETAMLYLPTIAAAELNYLFERKGWKRQWSELKLEMRKHTAFKYFSFSEDVLNCFEESRAREIHDKIIVSTANLLEAEAVITKDEELHRLNEVNTIW